MGVKRVSFCFDSDFFRKIQLSAVKNGYKNIQQFCYEAIRKEVYNKKHAGGRPQNLLFDDVIANKIARPTAESRKRIEWAKKAGLWH